MKLLNIAYTPSAEVHFTRRDLWLMMECSRRHYDDLEPDGRWVFNTEAGCWLYE